MFFSAHLVTVSRVAGALPRIGAAARGVGLCLLLALGGPLAAAEVSKEDQLKAAFLYNFTKFVEWPATCFSTDTSPIVLGVLGRNPFGGELEKIVAGRTVNGRPLVVKLVTKPEEVAATHLLFVPTGEESRVPAAAWRQAEIVTVGESEAFAALGATITFVPAGDKVRFEINIAAATRARVKISAQLQKLATAVRHQP